MSDSSILNTVIVALMIGGISVIFGIIPLVFKKLKHAGVVFELFHFLVNGFNLGNICYDIIPEINGECKNRKPFMVIGISILALLAIESLFQGDHGHSHGHSHSHDHSHENSHGHSHTHEETANDEKDPLVHGEQPEQSVFLDVEKTEGLQNLNEDKTSEKKHRHVEAVSPCTGHGHAHEEDHFGQEHLSYITKSKNNATMYIFLFAISVHSFFEGLDIHTHHIWNSHVVGLLLHKAAESLSIGMALFESKLKRRHAMIGLLLFCMLTPIALFIGRVCKSSFGWIEPWFKSLALGSLLYVVFLEGLGHLAHGSKKYMKMLTTLIGYALSVLFIALSHGEGGVCSHASAGAAADSHGHTHGQGHDHAH